MEPINPDVVQLWFHYEEIAMHFNELIIQYRLHLMGGIGLIGALSGYLIGNNVESPYMRHKLRALISSGLLVLFIAAAYLDLGYYNELLRGAVDALEKFESEHKEVYLSTYIVNRFSGHATVRIYITYAIVLIPFLLFTLWSWYVFIKEWLTSRSTPQG